MGLNTAMIVRNDFLHKIENDVEFGNKVVTAIRYSGHPERAPYHGQGFDVLPPQHADYIQVVAIGGNRIRRLGGYTGNYTSSDEEVLRRLRLEAENYEARIAALEAKNARLRDRVAELEKALEPFADIADLIDSETEGMSEMDELALHFHDYLMASWPVALFRAARRVREGEK